MTNTPRIYVADLAAYNNGILHGAWIDVSDDPESIRKMIQGMLNTSPISGAEEYAIHDYENFMSYPVAEYATIESLCQVAEYLIDFPEFGGELLNIMGDVEEARRIAGDGYCGLYSSLADYAQDLTEQTSNVPECLAPYIDYQAMGRDFELSGDLLVIEIDFEKVHIFHNS